MSAVEEDPQHNLPAGEVSGLREPSQVLACSRLDGHRSRELDPRFG